MYSSTTPSPPTTLQTYVGLLTFQSYVCPELTCNGFWSDTSVVSCLFSPPSTLETDASPEDGPQIPTIHVLETIEHSGPLVPLASLPKLSTDDWAATRKELISWIAEVGLGGEDEWLAEWILVALCSKK